MVRRSKQVALVAPVLLIIFLAALVVWSPYRDYVGFPDRLIKEAVEIDAPCQDVYEYLADSENARRWSVFVDHITPLNLDEAPDGAQGSIRRSYKRADEGGMTWDEYFELVEPLRRRLVIYNVQGVLTTEGELLTEQLYEPLGDYGCRLSFTLFFRERPSLGDEVLMRLSAHEIARIFRSNIRNVKRLNEVA